ncbi:hypothetical protein M422DRAFT_49526 [Sphaerobolus stellatus SS14]|uniref:BTB domain-containing protein n=1 Tax=Sphaerobolus stellatus (strain SS14) TaxID=990650 RepID=A0A0C9UXN0_SPHS4|nr:hypothetical protein M422DRAFT_49526 [Sphaerobolus stellatus SS14]
MDISTERSGCVGIREAVSARDTKTAKVYHEDGNVILLAENTPFKVHLGLLAGRSEVFCDIIAIAQGPQSHERFDNCPVLALSDSAERLENFLEILYGYRQLHLDDHETFSGVLELSMKYMVDSILDGCLALMTSILPVSLDGLDSVKSHSN